MNDQELIARIEELGLSNKEARVYVAALRIGPSAVQKIADQSGIKRVTTYVILESLVGLGLVSQSIRGKKTYFVAESPDNLKRLLEKREHELTEQKANFDHILPLLKSLKAIPQEMPEVKFYEGVEAVKTAIASFFAEYKGASRDIYAISNLDEIDRFLPGVGLGQPNPHRLKHNIRSHIIYTSSHGAVYRGTDDQQLRDSRYLSMTDFPIKGETCILGEYIIMISYEGVTPIAVTIRNRGLAQSMKTIFDLCWIAASSQSAQTAD